VRRTTIVQVTVPTQISSCGPCLGYRATPTDACGPFRNVRLVLIFDVVRLSAPVPWLSGRASASHAEGRWFDPSRDHKNRRSSEAESRKDCRRAEREKSSPVGLAWVTLSRLIGPMASDAEATAPDPLY
jgi:hypothetical protein